jgi:iron complex transport system substrate-binding protein
MRIVSLLASATEIVCALGAGEMLVGRSHECDNPDWVKRLPSCSAPAFDISGSSGEIDKEVRRRLHAGEPLYEVHADLIRDLHADLLITQSHCEVCAVTPADVNRSCGHATRQLSVSATSVEEVFQSILRISHALALDDRGAALVRHERERLARVQAEAARFARPTVVVVEWAHPIFVAGNWAPELVEIANGEALLSNRGEYSSSMAGERVREADPEFLIVAPCGFNLERSLQEKIILEQYPWWAGLSAVKNGKVAFADGNLFFNRSGMTVSQTAEIVAEILHGVVFGEATEGRYWRRMKAASDRDSRQLVSKPAWKFVAEFVSITHLAAVPALCSPEDKYTVLLDENADAIAEAIIETFSR